MISNQFDLLRQSNKRPKIDNNEDGADENKENEEEFQAYLFKFSVYIFDRIVGRVDPMFS